MDPVDSNYGVDDTSPIPIDVAREGVNVPEINVDLSQEVLTRLREQVDPLAASLNHGIELYEQALAILSS